jgi:hypothetical protein
MGDRDSETGNAEFDIGNASDGIAAKTVDDAIRMESHRPHIRELIANNHPAESRLHREAEAMGFDPAEVYYALHRVQEGYDAFEAAERRPVVDHGNNYVAFGLNGSDWHALFGFIKRQIDDEEMRAYIAQVVTKVMSDITGENWHTHNSLPLALSEREIHDVLAYHEEAYDGPLP